MPPPPISVDYTIGLPIDLGMLGNDSVGDCTAAAYFHARQVWEMTAQGKLETQADKLAIQLYSESCGYDPSNPLTDQGGVEQDVLTYLLNTGAPIGDGSQRDKILGFCEVDPRNLDDVKRVIADCGVCYLGIDIPAYLVAGNEPPAVWDYASANSDSAGGHAIILAAYDLDGFTAISWGRRYRLTNSFFANFTEEAYAIADGAWVKTTGKTPAGMSLERLEGQMEALRRAA